MIYVPSVIFPHDTVQYYVNEIAIQYTHKRLYQGSAVAAIAVGVIATLMFLGRPAATLTPGDQCRVDRSRCSCSWGRGGYSWRTIRSSFTSPNTSRKASCFLRLTASPLESIAWSTIFGGLDECFQYWVIVKGKPVPYDFNDIFMDLLGGVSGVVFAMALMRVERAGARSRVVEGCLETSGHHRCFGVRWSPASCFGRLV